VNLSQDDFPSVYPALASAADTGDLVVAWTNDTETGLRREVLARMRLGATGLWTDTINLSDSPETDDAGAVAHTDSLGRVHVAWTRRNTQMGTDLLHRQWDGQDWSAPEVLDHDMWYHPSPYGLSFVEGLSGTLCLFATRSVGEVAHTCWQGTGWEPLPPWSHVSGIRTIGAVAAGPDGLFHVAAFGENQGNVGPWDHYFDDAYYLTTDGESWGAPVNLSYTGTIAFDVELLFDQSGALHLFWSDTHPPLSLDSEQSAVYERVLVGGKWDERQEVTQPNQGQAVQDVAVLADAAGRLHVAWAEGLFNPEGAATEVSIYYRRQTAGVWEPEEVVYYSPDNSVRVDLALNPEGEPMLVWEEKPPQVRETFFSERVPLGYSLFLPQIHRNAVPQP
jgi:hypothetical protein